MKNVDIEIVGLAYNTNGRSCTVHKCCGEDVLHGNVLHLVKRVIMVDGNTKEAIACVKVVDGMDRCTIAFVSRIFANTERVQSHINKFVMVKELYEFLPNFYKWSKGQKNFGMASVCFLMEDEGRNE